MQILIRKLTGNSYALPLLVLAVCIWRIFVPQLPANGGLGWDGYRYYLLAVDGLQSSALDSYLTLRIFPSLFIHVVFKIFGVSFIPAHVIIAFKVMSSMLLFISARMVKKIFEHYKLDDVSELIGFVLVFLNYGVLNFTFYYPVMTDTPAFFMSVALFYFFIKGELTNILLVGLIGAFTWPVLAAMAVALILFPQTDNEFLPVKRSVWVAWGILCLAYAAFMGWYLIFKQGEKTDIAFALPLSYGMLPATFFCVGILYFFMPLVLTNRIFFSVEYYRNQLNANRVFAIVFLLIACLLVRTSVQVNTPSQYLSLYHQIKIHLLYAFQRPMITMVSHFNYFGCVVLLLVVFVKKFAAFVSRFGLGVAGAVFFNLFVFFMKPESRALIFFFPWLMIMMSLFIGQFKFSKIFYLFILVLNFAMAKLWLFFDYTNAPPLPDGTIGFPSQWFFMHLGIWMTEQVWFCLCITVAVSLFVLILSLYKIEFSKKEILFYKKFEPVSL